MNLAAGGLLPILGTLWTNVHIPAERQVDFNSAGTWAYFVIFFLTGLLGIALAVRASQLSKR
ncbi:MAG TPA: hypothetical protein VFY26_05230 [Anaerolineales bacterium]|nr:hypothetical protein [Anaerolineales bacterium]